jgi:O-antigen ligase
LLILWIVEGDWKRKWNSLKESNLLLITCGFALSWLLNVTGIFYSNDFIIGLTRTYEKLPFLVYPLVFFTLNKNYFTTAKFHILFKGFLCTTAVMLLICWGNAWIHYFTTHKMYHFYYVSFSEIFGHPAYCTVIVCIAFCITCFFLNHATKKNRWLWVNLLLFYGISVYFFQTRSGTLAFILILFFSLIYYWKNHKKDYGQVVGLVITVLLFSVMLVKLFPHRVENYISDIKVQEQSLVEKVFGIRSEIWSISFQIAMENKWIGVGSGYQNADYLTEADREVITTYSTFINAHNQFLQTFLEHGLVGLCLLLFLVIYSFYYAVKTKNYFLLMLLIIFFVNTLFESMLERHKGIFTFTLFYCLFVVKNNIFATVCKKQAPILDNS